jgi:Domain of unknown function (DUF1788)
MRSLTEKFNDLRSVLRQGLGSVRPTGFDPVYYLIFPPEEMLAVKQRMPEWEAQLKIDGFEVHQLSMIDVINGYFRNHDLRNDWIEAARLQNGDLATINHSLTTHLKQDNVVANAIKKKLAELSGKCSAVLFLTDIEALHPYLRIGAIENQLAGKFSTRTVVLYPGAAGGAYSRRFLTIHKEDGNYRSPHID